MCGNGVRVFMRYLQSAGLVSEQTDVLTRGGIKHVTISGDDIVVAMGRPEVFDDTPKVTTRGAVAAQSIGHVQMPNPHVVVMDANDKVVAVLGDNPEAPKTKGWPNIQSTLTNGKFNSCHACCVDSNGDAYVVEWISTGRIIKLVRKSAIPEME